MNWKRIMYIIFPMLIGILLGFFIAGRLTKSRLDRFRHMADKPQAERMHIAKRLSLSEEQRNRIEPILDEHLHRQRTSMKDHRAKMDSMRQSMYNEIRPFLDERQLNKLEEMKVKMKERRKIHSPHLQPN